MRGRRHLRRVLPPSSASGARRQRPHFRQPLGAAPRARGRDRSRRAHRLGPAWPHRRRRHRGRALGRSAAPGASAAASAARRRTAPDRACRRRRPRPARRAQGAGRGARRQHRLHRSADQRDAPRHRAAPDESEAAPHFYLTVDCEIDRLLAMRAEANAAADQKLSVNDFVIKAAALALKQVPDGNASWSDDAILQWSQIDISVAVALDHGLITPIIKNADKKGLAADLGRDAGSRDARASRQAEARGIPGRHLLDLQSRHVRHQGFHRGDQSAAERASSRSARASSGRW